MGKCFKFNLIRRKLFSKFDTKLTGKKENKKFAFKTVKPMYGEKKRCEVEKKTQLGLKTADFFKLIRQ